MASVILNAWWARNAACRSVRPSARDASVPQRLSRTAPGVLVRRGMIRSSRGSIPGSANATRMNAVQGQTGTPGRMKEAIRVKSAAGPLRLRRRLSNILRRATGGSGP